MKLLPLGSVSYGTQQPRHIIPKFLDALTSVDPERALKLKLEYARLRVAEADFAHELIQILNGYVPDYTYFGARDGEYGVWPACEALALDAAQGLDVLRLEAGQPWPGEGRYSYIMEVGQHGAVTLFNATNRKEIWKT